MFRLNPHTHQPALLSDLALLPAHQRERLEQSWAGTFRHEVFEWLDEQPFAVLYSDIASRPNTPVNVLVGLEMLKTGFDWSDAEMLDAFTFNMQVRYALGYENLGTGEFDLRTVYYFRRRLSDHYRTTGLSLFDRVFAQITDEQVTAFSLKTGRLRMDSTQISSNIRQMSRLQLLVEVAQRVDRMLTEAERAHYADDFAPYRRGTSGQYVYHLKSQATTPHLQQLGELFQRLQLELKAAYATHPTYELLVRVLGEQFDLIETDDPALPIQPKPGTAISPNSIQSPDDSDATYRRKGGVGYTGYVANVTETCESENPFQLIVLTQTAPNTTDDTTLLIEAMPALTARTDVDTLYTDGGFGSPEVDATLRAPQITLIQSALRGLAPDPNRLSLADFDPQPAGAADDTARTSATEPTVDLAPPSAVAEESARTGALEPTTDSDAPSAVAEESAARVLTCPHGQTANLDPGQKPGRFTARFTCPPDCPLLALCPTQSHRTDARRSLHANQADLDRAARRRRSRAARAEPGNPRAAVESTVGALKRPFSDDQLPVRGRFRLSQLIIGSAVMVNLRRIHRHLIEKVEKARTTAQQVANDATPPAPLVSFLVALRALALRMQCAMRLSF